MSSGQAHATATIILAGGLAAASIASATVDPWAAVGAATGLLVNPDLDLIAESGNISMQIIRSGVRKVGAARWLAEAVALGWALAWTPYSLAIPHRSPLSHVPIIGTAGRVMYVALAAMAGAWILWLPACWPDAFAALARAVEAVARAFSAVPPAFWAGLAAADALHAAMDAVSTASRRGVL